MPRKTNKNKWELLAPESIDNGFSDWKTVEQIKEIGLNWSNNGNQRHGKFLGITHYLWECEKSNGMVSKIRTIGLDPDIQAAELLKNRPIAKKIREYFNNVPCVACGSTKEMVVDHKNDLYNDPRVHSECTQEISDFQPLCNKCNLKKRADCTKTKDTGIRQPAPFQCIQMGGPNFIEGDEKFDPNGLGLKGTYWYDVKEYYETFRRNTPST